MDYEYQASKAKIAFMTKLMPSLTEQLNLQRFNGKTVITLCKTEHLGTTIQVFPGLVLVFIRDSLKLEELAETLAHEMVHVKQIFAGQLKVLKTGHRTWLGKKYKESTPYLEMPWELQALSLQAILCRKAVKAAGL
jgi:hypothetical protein